MKSDLPTRLFLAAVVGLLGFREYRAWSPPPPAASAPSLASVEAEVKAVAAKLPAIEAEIATLRADVAAHVDPPKPTPPKPPGPGPTPAPKPPEGDIEVAARAFAHWPPTAYRSAAALVRSGQTNQNTWIDALRAEHDKASAPLARAILRNPSGYWDGLERAAKAYEGELK